MVARLRLEADPSTAEIRSAYLATVKQYHPQHFARFGTEVEELASEVFLALKEAHDELLEIAAKDLPSGDEPGTPKIPNSPLAARVRRQRRTSRATQSSLQRVVRFKRPTKPPVDEGAPVRPLTAARTQPMPRASKSNRLAVIARDRNASAKKKATPANVAQPPSQPQPRKSQPVDHSSLVAQLASEQQNKDEAYRAALKLLREGRASEARLAFRELAVANPGEKRYRTYMHLAWGREHQLAKRFDEAAAEYRRALKVHPQFDPAVEALAELEEAAPKGGMLGRFFKRGRS